MRLSFKHIGLLIGCILVIISFLFFARQVGTYNILLLSGLAIAFAFYLTILFGRSPGRSKLFWTAIVILACVIQRLTEPLLINCSYRIYIDKHQKVLSLVNDILKKKTGDITISKDTVITEDNNLDSIEQTVLQQKLQQLNVYMIIRTDKRIYYELWGFLDTRLGIYYFYKQADPSVPYSHLTENWYH